MLISHSSGRRRCNICLSQTSSRKQDQVFEYMFVLVPPGIMYLLLVSTRIYQATSMSVYTTVTVVRAYLSLGTSVNSGNTARSRVPLCTRLPCK